jgi:NADPH:quinone reductase-like Zn-dependent oxidoreductase
MRALRFHQTGSLDNLSIEEISVPVPAAGEVLVQVKAAAINPSDVKNVLGKMHETTLPRIPGRDYAGIVVDGPAELRGMSVFGSGGNLGFSRDGSHAQFLTVPVNAAIPLPKNLSFEQAAAMGVSYLTAWAAMVNVARVQPEETVLILGTTGAVGSAAARIAHSLKARVIGTARKASEIPSIEDLPIDDWIHLDTTDLAAGVRAVTNGRGADVVLDVVGGAMFEKCLASLALRGRQVAISSSPDPRVSFNLVDFYHNESRLLGLDSLKITFEESAQTLRLLTPGIESGIYPPPRLQTFPLDDAPRLYRELVASKMKPILVP